MSLNDMTEQRRGAMPPILAWLLWLALAGAVLLGALLSFGVGMWAMEVAMATGRRDEWIGSILLLALVAASLGLIAYSAVMMRRSRRRRAYAALLAPLVLLALVAIPFMK